MEAVQNKVGEAHNKIGEAKDKVMGKIGLGGSSGGTDAGASSDSPDLKKLAEDVFPLVKRLLEIETDRISGHLR